MRVSGRGREAEALGDLGTGRVSLNEWNQIPLLSLQRVAAMHCCRCERRADYVIDPAVRTQEIKSQLDTVSATLHKLATEINPILTDPHGTKTKVLTCKTLLEDIAREIDDGFPIGGAAR
jgi:hypothetical protein